MIWLYKNLETAQWVTILLRKHTLLIRVSGCYISVLSFSCVSYWLQITLQQCCACLCVVLIDTTWPHVSPPPPAPPSSVRNGRSGECFELHLLFATRMSLRGTSPAPLSPGLSAAAPTGFNSPQIFVVHTMSSGLPMTQSEARSIQATETLFFFILCIQYSAQWYVIHALDG